MNKSLLWLLLLVAAALPALAYRDLETGAFISRDPIGNTLMQPADKWFVDGRQVSQEEYVRAVYPGSYADTAPAKTAKTTQGEQQSHVESSLDGNSEPGKMSHWHIAEPGQPNIYAYCLDNPWTKFDPEGLKIKVEEKDQAQVSRDLHKIFKGTFSFDKDGMLSRTKTKSDTGFDKRLDKLIDSTDTYKIAQEPKFVPGTYTPNNQSGVEFRPSDDPRDLGRGGTVNYNQSEYSYPGGFSLFGKSTVGNGASTLGHELMRAYAHEIGEPQNNDAKARQTVVDRANEGYTRQGLNPRTSY